MHSRRVQPRRAGILSAFANDRRPGFIARPFGTDSTLRCEARRELGRYMDTGTHATASRPHPIHVVDAAKTLNVTVTYGLSEAGRKASLLSGGDGRARQQLSIQVPAARLHLVAVDPGGVARLKLQPRYELSDSDRIVRHDAPPVYDVPPSIDDLYRDAARNHELERLFLAQRNSWRGQRREADRERRADAAREFLSNASHRAIVHPAPTPKRCFLQTATGRLMFDIESDVGIAKDVPNEAHRRFRADLQVRKQRNLNQRSEQLELHNQKKAAAHAWIEGKGTIDQKARAAAGLLALDEVVAAMADESFSGAADVPRYEFDGAARLQSHLRETLGDASVVVAPSDLQVTSVDATSASKDQWSVVSTLQSKFPDATIKLREHRLSSRRYPDASPLTVFGVLVSRRDGPFTLRREFAAPGR